MYKRQLIKRRTVANEACDAGRVLVNGTVAKASVKVKRGDVIEIQFGTKTVTVSYTHLDVYKRQTIGPACAQLETLQRMVEAGMTGIRMNLSHGPLSCLLYTSNRPTKHQMLSYKKVGCTGRFGSMVTPLGTVTTLLVR